VLGRAKSDQTTLKSKKVKVEDNKTLDVGVKMKKKK